MVAGFETMPWEGLLSVVAALLYGNAADTHRVMLAWRAHPLFRLAIAIIFRAAGSRCLRTNLFCRCRKTFGV